MIKQKMKVSATAIHDIGMLSGSIGDAVDSIRFVARVLSEDGKDFFPKDYVPVLVSIIESLKEVAVGMNVTAREMAEEIDANLNSLDTE